LKSGWLEREELKSQWLEWEELNKRVVRRGGIEKEGG
jgi:hypothetical protein